MCGEDTAKKLGITREDQDVYALQSYSRSAAATEEGRLAKEIVPIEFTVRGKTTVISEDEEFRNVNPEKVSCCPTPAISLCRPRATCRPRSLCL